MRSLAAAQVWRRTGGSVTYAACSIPPALVAHLENEGCSVEHWDGVEPGGPEDARCTRRAVARSTAKALILDGYHFGNEFRKAVAPAAPAASLLFHDYEMDDPLWLEFVLNSNPEARTTLYPQVEASRQLLGLEWAPLRNEFVEAVRRPRGQTRAEDGERPTRILVTLGGGASSDLTYRVIQGLDAVALPLEVRVVVGTADSQTDRLRRKPKLARHPTRMLHEVSDMSGLMDWADIAVAAAGSTSWELAWMGVPWISITRADNQRPIGEAVGQAGMALSLGWHENVDESAVSRAVARLIRDPEQRRLMSARGVSALDGLGARRIVKILMGQG